VISYISKHAALNIWNKLLQ